MMGHDNKLIASNEYIVLLPYLKKFKNKIVFFSGSIFKKDFLLLNLKKNYLHTNQYIKDLYTNNFNLKNIDVNILPNKKLILNCDVLVFFWIKNKIESVFELNYLCSIMKNNQKILIIGKKKSGINSIKKIFLNKLIIKKIKNKKKCILYIGMLKKKTLFYLKSYFKQHIIYSTTIITLPGIFGYKKIDPGSILLLSTFHNIIQKDVLDIGSGSGVLSVVLKKIFNKINITLIDNNYKALLCSKLTLLKNNLSGNIIHGNIYSSIKKKFNLIISNPPTHYENSNNNIIIKKIIVESKKFLYKNGELRIVIHSYIPCYRILQETFGNYKILKKMNHYTVYQSFLK